MSNVKLFTEICISETAFINRVLKSNKTKKYKFELLESQQLADNLYHFVYSKDEKKIHIYFFIGEFDTNGERHLFVENNDLYREYISQFWEEGEIYGEWRIDVYLDVAGSSEDILKELTEAYNNSFYEEDEPMPVCHIFGQQMWNDNAYMIANRAALMELKQAIDRALKYGETRLDLSLADNEPYDLFIKCAEESFNWAALELSYHNKEYYEHDETTEIPPHKVFKNYKQHLRKR